MKVITPPALPVIPLADVKLHLRVDHATDDALITAKIEAARAYVEHYTQLVFGEQTLELALDGFTETDIPLPYGALAVTSIKYDSPEGVETTLAAINYTLDTYTAPATVSPAVGLAWPTARNSKNSVRIRYSAGSVPSGAVLAAMLLTIGHLYENREGSTQYKLESIPFGINALLDTVKVY